MQFCYAPTRRKKVQFCYAIDNSNRGHRGHLSGQSKSSFWGAWLAPLPREKGACKGSGSLFATFDNKLPDSTSDSPSEIHFTDYLRSGFTTPGNGGISTNVRLIGSANVGAKRPARVVGVCSQISRAKSGVCFATFESEIPYAEAKRCAPRL